MSRSEEVQEILDIAETEGTSDFDGTYIWPLIHYIAELEEQLEAVRCLPDKWRKVIEKAKTERKHDMALNRGMIYLSSAANELDKIIAPKALEQKESE